MPEPIDLEINLSRPESQTYHIELRASDPENPTLRPPVRGALDLDLDRLRGLRLDPAGYGRLLSQALLAEPEIRSGFDQARAVAQSGSRELRLRLFIDRSAAELNDLRWETLRDPQDGGWLLARPEVLFSRFLRSDTWERVVRRSKSALRLLALMANPSDLADGQFELNGQPLAPVDVAGETARLQAALGSIQPTVLASDPAHPGQAGLQALTTRLAEGCDILYLVCHGALLQKQDPPGPYLWLEKADGSADLVHGSRLVETIRSLLPALLVVLASCQSAGPGGTPRLSDAGEMMNALGPQLAQAGIPAVLAMQGSISMDTVAAFMPAMFGELARDGRIDRAVALGRDRAREQPDAWMPVLYLRLSDGRVWYTPGFSDKQQDEFERWESLTSAIGLGECTALLGPGLVEPLIGPQREIALRWAEKHGYPLSVADREELPRVAQYVATRQSSHYVRTILMEALREELLRYYRQHLPVELQEKNAWTADQTMQAMRAAATAFWKDGDASPYQRLARLRLPLYITANSGDLLEYALKASGVTPQVRLCPWNSKIIKKIAAEKYIYESTPTPDAPLIYHLYGHLSEPTSLVITEDDYFDYLIGMTRNKDLIPACVLSALSSNALLFLGFRMDDWAFRVLFRVILQQEGSYLLEDHSHAAVQIEPEDDQITDAGRARRFLELYFQSGNVSLFWGSSEDFLAELVHHVGANP
jgi:hypothetical protein